MSKINLADYKNKKCACDEQLGCSPMGLYADRNINSGKYYLNTNRNSPYCQG